MGKIWFTADLHLGHANIIKYCNRPFASAEEMNAQLIDRWNQKVDHKDEVYILGDVSAGPVGDVVQQVKALHGRKYLIAGNHDKRNLKNPDFRNLFTWIKDLYLLKVQDETLDVNVQRIVLCHYAMRTWDHAHHGSWQLYGHSHGSMPDDPALLSIDVGVDCWDFAPIGYDEIKVRMALKTPKYLLRREQDGM